MKPTNLSAKAIKKTADKKDFKDADKARVPVDLVPADMKEISSEIFCKGLMNKITFIKP